MSKSTKQHAEEYFDDIFSKQLINDEAGALKLLTHDEIITGQQPRTLFDTESLKELSASIRDLAEQGRGLAGTGILQPLLAYFSSSDRSYTLIAGERRFRASKLAGIEKIPVLLVDFPVKTENNVQELSAPDNKSEAFNYFFLEQLIENLQREDLSPLEEAFAFEQLGSQKNLSQRELAQLLGKSRGYITNRLSILKFKPDVQSMVVSRETTLKHAPLLDAIDDDEIRHSLIKSVLNEQLSVRALEIRIEQHNKQKNTNIDSQGSRQNSERKSRGINSEQAAKQRPRSAKSIRVEDLIPALSLLEGAHQKYQLLSTTEKMKLNKTLQDLYVALEKFDVKSKND